MRVPRRLCVGAALEELRGSRGRFGQEEAQGQGLRARRESRRGAPGRTSSRFPPRATALSLSFFLTEATSRSAKLFEGRTNAQATRNPHSSSTAKSARAIGVSRGTPEYVA